MHLLPLTFCCKSPPVAAVTKDSSSRDTKLNADASSPGAAGVSRGRGAMVNRECVGGGQWEERNKVLNPNMRQQRLGGCFPRPVDNSDASRATGACVSDPTARRVLGTRASIPCNWSCLCTASFRALPSPIALCFGTHCGCFGQVKESVKVV